MPAGNFSRRKRKPALSIEERRENALRPGRYLGYNRDELGLYFLDRDACHTAEQQFRRAVWLNPFEPEFKVHLAGCLFRLHRDAEALHIVNQAIEQMPQHQVAHKLKELLEARLSAASSPPTQRADAVAAVQEG